jgi:hypothetical protein
MLVSALIITHPGQYSLQSVAVFKTSPAHDQLDQLSHYCLFLN